MKTHLTLEDIEAVIESEKYEFPSGGMTICILTLKNGARVIGVNYGAIDKGNQDWNLGRKNAREQAIEKVWELEGYLLRQRLSEVRETQDKKYSIRDGRIVNSSTLEPIPENEPVMLFRAKDIYALDHAILPYLEKIDSLEGNKSHSLVVSLIADRFRKFQENNPESMKVPDTTLTKTFLEGL